MSVQEPKVCHINDVARHFLDTYLRGGEVDGGWKFAKALQQTQLDYSDESLGRLDRLLASIRERARPSREVLQESVSGRNFCSLISYYSIEFVCRRAGHHDVAGCKLFPLCLHQPSSGNESIKGDEPADEIEQLLRQQDPRHAARRKSRSGWELVVEFVVTLTVSPWSGCSLDSMI
jgi:hypothetical protein